MEQVSDNVTTFEWKESILDTIRERPAMYMGVKSLTALKYYLEGYETARFRFGGGNVREVPKRFADWVAYRLHLDSNWSGFWHHLILSQVPDEALAVDKFYELRDSFYSRKALTVATIHDERREYRVGKVDADGHVTDCIEELPKSLRIVVYTDDPGFFLIANEEEGFFLNGWFFCALDSILMPPMLDRFSVQEEHIWNRLLEENREYKRKLDAM